MNGEGMSNTASTISPRLPRAVLMIAAAAGVVIAATLALWAHYGTTVFYEMIAAGIAACL
jgi:prepilin signal peptidase PulO-like enzyme (type II secretory pathway)